VTVAFESGEKKKVGSERGKKKEQREKNGEGQREDQQVLERSLSRK